MAAVTIRVAAHEDVAALCPLYWAFHEFHAGRLPDRLHSRGAYDESDTTQLQAELSVLVTSKTAAVLVAELSHQLVGFAEVHLAHDEPHPARDRHRYGHLVGLLVIEANRRQGIGTRLVGAAERWARARGADEIRLDSWEFAEGPMPFYERLGYRTVSRTFVKGLPRH